MSPSTSSLAALDLDATDAEVVVAAPASGAGNWSGAASAVRVGAEIYLTYRVRRPLTEGRGVTTVVARSRDGVQFDTVAEVHRNAFGAESFERPVLLAKPEGGWRLYLSCATPGSKHWWIEALDADDLTRIADGDRTVAWSGSPAVATKDPVIVVDATGWHAWVCEHPLDEADHEDRMSTAHYRSRDGLAWERTGTVLAPTAGSWDARGARVTTVLSTAPLTFLYDGRARREDNWHETTGLAHATDAERGLSSPLSADATQGTARSRHSDGALRYASAVRLDDGRTRLYVERAREDGAHDLVTLVRAF